MTKSTCWKISCKVAASLDFTRLSRQAFRLLENSPKTLSSLFGSSEQNFRRFCRVSAERDMKCSDTIWEEKRNKVFRLSERAMEWPSLFLRARSFEFRFSVGGGSRNSDCPNVRYGKFWKICNFFAPDLVISFFQPKCIVKGADEKLQKVLRIFCNQLFEDPSTLCKQ